MFSLYSALHIPVELKLENSNPRVTTGKKDGYVFETLEDLLQSVSKFYERKRQQLLFAKLEKCV